MKKELPDLLTLKSGCFNQKLEKAPLLLRERGIGREETGI